MKILLISHMYPTKENSIVGNFVHAQAKWLKKIGHDVEVMVPKGVFPVLRKSLGYDKYNMDGVSVKYIEHFTLSNLGHLFTDRIIAKKIEMAVNVEKYDLIFAHTILPDGSAAVKLGKRYKKPVSVYIHGADVQKKTGIFYLRGKIKDTLTLASQILVNSSKTKRLTDEIVEGRAQACPLGIGKLPEYKKTKNKVTKIISVGNLVPEKGHDYSIRAIKELTDEGHKILFGIIGAGSEEASLKKLAKGYENINFMGRRDNDFVQKKLAEADIFLLPSWNEAFGMVYLEALWQKTPIIGCATQGVEDIFGFGEVGVLVESKSSKSIKEAITKLSENSEERAKYATEGKKIVKKHYLWENNVRKLEELLKGVVS